MSRKRGDQGHWHRPNKDKVEYRQNPTWWRSNTPRKKDTEQRTTDIHQTPITILRQTSASQAPSGNSFEQKSSLFRHKPCFTLYNKWNTQTNADKVFLGTNDIPTTTIKGDISDCTRNIWTQLMYSDTIEIQYREF